LRLTTLSLSLFTLDDWLCALIEWQLSVWKALSTPATFGQGGSHTTCLPIMQDLATIA